ncbi:MAG: Hpt domain-containing protein [Pseudobacteriovorax sp.]|nr:Hpt domain-containing protein [Pseudobacteriovorax sp.]
MKRLQLKTILASGQNQIDRLLDIQSSPGRVCLLACGDHEMASEFGSTIQDHIKSQLDQKTFAIASPDDGFLYFRSALLYFDDRGEQTLKSFGCSLDQGLQQAEFGDFDQQMDKLWPQFNHLTLAKQNIEQHEYTWQQIKRILDRKRNDHVFFVCPPLTSRNVYNIFNSIYRYYATRPASELANVWILLSEESIAKRHRDLALQVTRQILGARVSQQKLELPLASEWEGLLTGIVQNPKETAFKVSRSIEQRKGDTLNLDLLESTISSMGMSLAYKRDRPKTDESCDLSNLLKLSEFEAVQSHILEDRSFESLTSCERYLIGEMQMAGVIQPDREKITGRIAQDIWPLTRSKYVKAAYLSGILVFAAESDHQEFFDGILQNDQDSFVNLAVALVYLRQALALESSEITEGFAKRAKYLQMAHGLCHPQVHFVFDLTEQSLTAVLDDDKQHLEALKGFIHEHQKTEFSMLTEHGIFFLNVFTVALFRSLGNKSYMRLHRRLDQLFIEVAQKYLDYNAVAYGMLNLGYHQIHSSRLTAAMEAIEIGHIMSQFRSGPNRLDTIAHWYKNETELVGCVNNRERMTFIESAFLSHEDACRLLPAKKSFLAQAIISNYLCDQTKAMMAFARQYAHDYLSTSNHNPLPKDLAIIFADASLETHNSHVADDEHVRQWKAILNAKTITTEHIYSYLDSRDAFANLSFLLALKSLMKAFGNSHLDSDLFDVFVMPLADVAFNRWQNFHGRKKACDSIYGIIPFSQISLSNQALEVMTETAADCMSDITEPNDLLLTLAAVIAILSGSKAISIEILYSSKDCLILDFDGDFDKNLKIYRDTKQSHRFSYGDEFFDHRIAKNMFVYFDDGLVHFYNSERSLHLEAKVDQKKHRYIETFLQGSAAIPRLFANISNTWRYLVAKDEQERSERQKVISINQQTRRALELAEIAHMATEEISEKSNVIASILKNIHQGIFTFDKGRVIQKNYSPYLETIFEASNLSELTLDELIVERFQIPRDKKDMIYDILNLAFNYDMFSFEVNEWNLPRSADIQIKSGIKSLEFDWLPILNRDSVSSIMVTIRDVTQINEIKKEKRRAEQRLRLINTMLKVESKHIHRFFTDLAGLIQEVRSMGQNTEGKIELQQDLHSMKGMARVLGFPDIASSIHNLESQLSHKHVSDEACSLISDEISWALQIFQDINKESRFIHSELIADFNELKDHLKQQSTGAATRVILDKIERQLHPRTDLDAVLEPIIESSRAHAASVGKEPPRFEVTQDNVSLDDAQRRVLSHAFMHLVTNAIDHSIEPEADRWAKGKDGRGRIFIRLTSVNDVISIEVTDDGAGANLELLQKSWQKTRRNPETSLATPGGLEEILFQPGVTTQKELSEYSGRGMGLAAVKADFERMGWSIRVEFASTKQPGSTRAPLRFVIQSVQLNQRAS